jgi:hypothetical protein
MHWLGTRSTCSGSAWSDIKNNDMAACEAPADFSDQLSRSVTKTSTLSINLPCAPVPHPVTLASELHPPQGTRGRAQTCRVQEQHQTSGCHVEGHHDRQQLNWKVCCGKASHESKVWHTPTPIRADSRRSKRKCQSTSPDSPPRKIPDSSLGTTSGLHVRDKGTRHYRRAIDPLPECTRPGQRR